MEWISEAYNPLLIMLLYIYGVILHSDCKITPLV